MVSRSHHQQEQGGSGQQLGGTGGGAGVGEVTPILYGGRLLHWGFLDLMLFVFTFLSTWAQSVEGKGVGEVTQGVPARGPYTGDFLLASNFYFFTSESVHIGAHPT